MKTLILLTLTLLPFFIQAQNLKLDSTSKSAFSEGVKEAKNSYKLYKGAATTTLIVSILNPLLGLAPAIGGTTGEPSIMMVNYDKLKNEDYYKGYMSTAKSIRSKKVWKNWIVGTIISAGITFATLKIIQSNNKANNGYRIPGF